MKANFLRTLILILFFSTLSCVNFAKKSEINKDFINSKINDVELDKIQIGNQIWLSKNLATSAFRNGDSIPEAKSYEEWKSYSNNKKPAYCYFNFEKKYGEKYGKLYNWFTIIDQRSLAPSGWKIPSYSDFEKLENTIKKPINETINQFNSNLSIGYKLKSQIGWQKYEGQNGNGNNQYGFNALPGGYAWLCIIESKEKKYIEGISFQSEGEETYFWTSEPERFNYLVSNGYYNGMTTGFVAVSATFCCQSDFGFYVRLISEN